MPLTIQEALGQAVEAHKLGKLREAEGLYRAILEVQPGHADANHNLGVIAVAVGKPEAGLPYLKAALEANPEQGQYWVSYMEALMQVDKPEVARDILRQGKARGLNGEAISSIEERLSGEGRQEASPQIEKPVGSPDRRPSLKKGAGKKGKNKKGPNQSGMVGKRGSPTEGEVSALVQEYNAGALEIAEQLAQTMIQKFPRYPLGWKAHGAILHQTGRLEQALESLQRAVSLQPNDAEALSNLGGVLNDLGRSAEAESCCRKATRFNPNYAEAHSNLGNALQALGQPLEAKTSCLEAIRLKPDFAVAHSNLGNALYGLGQLAEAEASFREAIRLKPDIAVAHGNLGNVLYDLGRLEEAEASFRDAIRIKLDYLEAHYNLGNALVGLDCMLEAEASFRKAIEIKPDYAKAHNNLGNVLLLLDRPAEAEASIREALRLEPDSAVAHSNLANMFLFLGLLSEAEASYREAIRLKANYTVAHSNLIFSMNYAEALSLADSLAEAKHYGARVSERAKPKYAAWDMAPHPEKLRIGLVSGDLRIHPVGYFLEGLIKEMDQSRFELVAYSTSPKGDGLTQRIRPFFKDWVFIGGMSDLQAAQLIHEQAPHILIDLAGHTAHNRLPVFAYRPAPVQVTWLGYFATTGLPEMDYILANPHVIPAGEEGHFTEQVWRLPQTSLCYTPPDFPVDVLDLPALANGFVTFGCFNTLTKMNERVIAVWAEILKRVPGSKLFLKTRQYADRKVVTDVVAAYARQGVAQDRLVFEGRSKRGEYLAAYNRVDLALDPFPFPGGTTSIEGLWMGVPVLTLKGDRFISHQGEAIVRNVGLPHWIAEDTQDYVAKAVQFSQDIQGLATLRSGLRARLLNSPLCDARRFARHFEAALRGMWEAHQKTMAHMNKPEVARDVLGQSRQEGVNGESIDLIEEQVADAGHQADGGPTQEEISALLQQFNAGALDMAEQLARSMVQRFPGHPFGWKAYGAILLQTGQLEEALESVQRAVQLCPDDAEAHSNLGAILKNLSRLMEAEASYREAARLRPDFAEAHNNLGNALLALGRLKEAEASYREAIRLKPGYAEAHNNLGTTLLVFGRHTEAEASYREAIRLKPDCVKAHNNLGNVLLLLDHPVEAEARYRETIRLEPDYAVAYSNLGSVLKDLGRLSEAEASYRKALCLKPDFSEVHSNLLFSMNYAEALPLADALAEAKHYGARVSGKANPKYAAWHMAPHPEKLKIGLVSGDLINHPVGFFLEGLLGEIDQSRIELVAYATNAKTDDLTQRIQPFFKDWVFIGGMSDSQAAQLIHEQAPHVLIDLAGHTAHNRLPVFAYKPAPIQVTWLGYFATTGLPEMDYILANPHVIPAGEEGHFTEQVWRLPQTSLCYTPPDFSVDVLDLPALANGFVTFGCFNTLTKMNERVIAVWAEILGRVPGSKLLLKTRQYADPQVVDGVVAAYARQGVSQDRLMFEGRSKERDEYFAAYNRVDLALDPFPFPGGTTSVEGLWMGVPVLTLKGDRFISHQGEAIVRNVGMDDWIAENVDDYVAKAVQFSQDLQALATLRGGLRAQLLDSPPCDARRFARYFEAALWGMWDEYRKGKAPDNQG